MKGSLLHFLYLNFINFNVSLIQKTPVYVWLNICVLHTGQPNWHIKLTIMESFPNDYFWTFCKMGHVYTQSMSCRLLLTGPPLSSSPPILGLTGEGSCLWFMWISHYFEIIPLPPQSDHYWLTTSVKWSQVIGSPAHIQHWIHIVLPAQEGTDLYSALTGMHFIKAVMWRYLTVLIETAAVPLSTWACLSLTRLREKAQMGWLGWKMNTVSGSSNACLSVIGRVMIWL